MKNTILVGVDPGSEKSGIVVLTQKGIREGTNIGNESVFDYILTEKSKCDSFMLVIEDMRPYNMRITDEVIQTIKYLGQLEWRLNEANIAYTLIPRWQIKQWVFLQFRTMAEPEIVKKIEASNRRKLAANLPLSRKQQPTFVFVDDRIVQKAMRIHWGIKKPTKVGQKAAFNLKDHSWQALGLASYYIVLHRPVALLSLNTV